jgi:hypothetical protein
MINDSTNGILSQPLGLFSVRAEVAQRYDTLKKRDISLVEHMERRDLGRRSIAGRPNGTLDPYYQCSLLGELWDYAANYSYPWSASGSILFRVHAERDIDTGPINEGTVVCAV